jgi:hypothetical protein
VAEGGGLLNRYRGNTPIVGSNPIPSATLPSLLVALRRSLMVNVLGRAAAVLLALGLVLWAPRGRAAEASAEAARQHLYAGTITAGIAELQQRVAADGGDREARFGLGALQFVRAVEHLGQGFYHYGLRSPRTISAPLLRLPVPSNPNPEPIGYEDFRAQLQSFTDDLAAADARLADVGDGEVRFVLDLMRVRLDMRGDGKPGDDETLGQILSAVSGGMAGPSTAAQGLEVKFDAGDAAWLRGYTHILMALDEFLLAHDFRVTFETTFHLFFARSRSPLADALAAPAPPDSTFGTGEATQIADAVALIHTLNWPVIDAARETKVRAHLLQVVALSRQSWTLIEAETGDDREWIPNPRQKNSALGLTVSEQELRSWFELLDEAQAILEGRKLIPHWRFRRGFDVKKFLDEQQSFDLVMLLSGAGAVPFLADGDVTSSKRWGEMTGAFAGGFLLHVVWFN